MIRHNPSLAEHVAEMVFLGVKLPENSIHFFRLLTLLTELSAGPAGLPCYTTLIMYRVWDLAMSCPQAALDWLSIQVNITIDDIIIIIIIIISLPQVTRNRFAQAWLLGSLSDWVEQYLIAHSSTKVTGVSKKNCALLETQTLGTSYSETTNLSRPQTLAARSPHEYSLLPKFEV